MVSRKVRLFESRGSKAWWKKGAFRNVPPPAAGPSLGPTHWLPALSYTQHGSYVSRVYSSQTALAVCWGTRTLLLRTPPSPGLAHQGDQRRPGALGKVTNSVPGPGKPSYSNLPAHGGLKKYLVASSSSPGRPSQVGLTPHPALLPDSVTLITRSHRRVDD